MQITYLPSDILNDNDKYNLTWSYITSKYPRESYGKTHIVKIDSY